MEADAGDPAGSAPRHAPEAAAKNELDVTSTTGDVVQARDVQGGIHFHSGQTIPAPERTQVPHQLPTDVRGFVNREREFLELRASLDPVTAPDRPGAGSSPAWVVVITGSAGVGKTALALHFAHHVRSRFPDGQLYLNLRGYDSEPPVEPAVALDRILRDLGTPAHLIPPDPDSRAALYRTLVADRRLLILLDNAAAVAQVRPLIPGTPGTLLVVTSRNRLPGLSVRDGAQRIELDVLPEPDAVALLKIVTSATAREDSQTDLAELARLCARLPLALRIAGERAATRPSMDLSELIQDLRDDSVLWDALSVGDDAEPEAVRTVFAWSYRALPQDAARIFRIIGLHPGSSISLDAAAAASGLTRQAARRALDILLGAFLLEALPGGRYQLHDLLRAYAQDQSHHLDSPHDRLQTLDRLFAWYVAAGDSASRLIAPGDRTRWSASGPDREDSGIFTTAVAALGWFELERQNLVASATAAHEAGLHLRAVQLALAVSPIHMQHFVFDDWSAMSHIAVSAASAMDEPALLAAALENRGKYLLRIRSLVTAEQAFTQALELRTGLDDDHGIGEALNALGLTALHRRDLATAADRFSAAAEIFNRVQDRLWEGLARSNLAESRLKEARHQEAAAVLADLPELFRDLGEAGYEGNALWLQSWAARLSGDLDDAQACINRALVLAEEAHNRMWEAFWLLEAARIHLATGNHDEALRCCQMAASLERQIGDRSREASAIDVTGQVLAAMGNDEEAAAFHLQAFRAHRDLGDEWQQAVALIHLGRCLRSMRRGEQERQYLSLANSLLESFPDIKAAEFRNDIRVRLAEIP